jgi:hypothetical protein
MAFSRARKMMRLYLQDLRQNLRLHCLEYEMDFVSSRDDSI